MPRLPKALLWISLCVLTALRPCFAQEQEGGRVERDHATARAEYQRSGRTARGENAADLLHRGYQQKMAMREAVRRKMAEAGRAHPEHSSTPNYANLVWQSLGPSPLVFDPTNLSAYGNVTGRVSAIAVDQNDATGNTVYIGGASGGVWKSTNAANSDPNAVAWTPLTDDQASLAVGAIAVQPGGNVLLVGTGETNSSPDSYYGQGILRSIDGGHTWTLISSANSGTRSFRGLGFSRIAFSSANPSLVVAAAASTNGSSPGGNGGEIQGANGRGLYYSTDAGLTWSYASVTDFGTPTQAGSVGDVVFDSAHGKFYAVLRWHGYYSSTDGATWTRLANQPGLIDSGGLCPANPTNNNCPEYRGSLSVREDTGEVFTIFVDANAQTTADGGGIFVLSQDGGTWTQLGQAGIDGCGDPGSSSGCGTQQGTYNLYIKAVPNGTNTDLYVGAINIFKCSRSASNPFCTNPSSWLNLTHVYGCSPLGAPSHVHPDQHAIDFSKTAVPILIYFGNDGGVWRARDETALNSTSCGGANPFDNLNGNIGSLSEFVSFAQHPSDPEIILGGLQDNGSPVLVPGNAGANGLLWQGVNDSDGGYNAIDPGSPNVFYTSLFDVSVQRCVSGTSCNQSTWASIVGPLQVARDGAAFYPPWMLDPQNSSQLVIGTCRLWRGPAAGGTYLQLSNNFSSGDSTVCSGSTSTGDTKVRSIAMGGPMVNGNSQVIYAGAVGSTPLNGHVFVTTSADSGTSSWIDRTGNINPSGYDISDIAISPYDSTGRTAYLTIMGFGTGHVFKTSDAGANWTDKSSNLPDVPANSVVVDPVTPSTIYIGTDVGVFVTNDDGATWAELGTGLPNAPAVKVKTFVSGNVKKLRAATYGRGMWQIDLPQPDINFFSAPLSFAAIVGRSSAGQTVMLTNDSTGPVVLSGITAGGDFMANSGCPPVLNPSDSCPVTVTFRAHAAGASNNTLTLTSNAAGGTRSLPLNGQGVDFSLTALGPRLTRPQRNGSQGSNSAINIARGTVATVPLTLNVTNADSLSSLPSGDRSAKFTCASTPEVRCEISPSVADMAAGEVKLELSVWAPTSRSKRLATRGGTVNVQVRATAGSAVRVVNVPVQY